MSAPSIDQLKTKMSDISTFESHPQMQPPTPNPTIFFLYDFIRNTNNSLQQIDSSKVQSNDRAALNQLQEVRGRNSFAGMLVNDTTGNMAMLMGGQPGQPGQPVDFGEEIKAKVAGLSEA